MAYVGTLFCSADEIVYANINQGQGFSIEKHMFRNRKCTVLQYYKLFITLIILSSVVLKGLNCWV